MISLNAPGILSLFPTAPGAQPAKVTPLLKKDLTGMAGKQTETILARHESVLSHIKL